MDSRGFYTPVVQEEEVSICRLHSFKKLVAKIEQLFSLKYFLNNTFFSSFFTKGFLNRFLSWHGFRPIARLSFHIYLIHYLVVFYRIFTVKEVYAMSDKLMVSQ